MSIQFTTTIKDDLLIVRTKGRDESPEEVEKYGASVIEICKKKGCNKILIDERELKYNISTVDIYYLAKYYAEIVPSLVKAALVYNPAFKDDAKFWEDAITNRGLIVRIFTDIEQARQWLMES